LDPTTIETETKEPELVEVAREILEYRLDTTTTDIYRDWKLCELDKLDFFENNSSTHVNGLHGLFGEALFLDFIRQSDIEILISSGEDDFKGIDFYFGGFPIDVTTNPTSLDEKTNPERYTTLYLPRYRGQKSVLGHSCYSPNGKDYVLKHIKEKYIPKESYMYDILTVNLEILEALKEQIENPDKEAALCYGGLNNERNLFTILKILINSNLWTKEEEKLPIATLLPIEEQLNLQI